MNGFLSFGCRAFFAAVSLGTLLASGPLRAADEPAGKAIPLFDGKSLDGWEGNFDWFRVEEGAIVAGHTDRKIPRNEFLCTTKEYGDFDLRLKFKLLGKGANAGVQFRSRRIPNHHEVKGYQADMGDGWWGALYDESRRNKVLARPDAGELRAYPRTLACFKAM